MIGSTMRASAIQTRPSARTACARPSSVRRPTVTVFSNKDVDNMLDSIKPMVRGETPEEDTANKKKQREEVYGKAVEGSSEKHATRAQESNSEKDYGKRGKADMDSNLSSS
ncbi:hypothetical protein HaLaN_11325 [Haematococcus lacustris]|uniref:Uncharacterized protein n=1 Tax=Haematococcus lacustris TaxID=44745 RepID=A0A699YZL3_HAELA|nr:hypothetical protein HaLaN_08618 [Haematococcus lacustris]GFH15151.1 hypothetical protein HaLaN_11325 [Haematococcus lacustris]